MTTLRFLLIGLLVVSGAATWFMVYDSLATIKNQPLTVQTHSLKKNVEEEPLSLIIQDSKDIPAFHSGDYGLTYQDVYELHAENQRVSIDELLTYVERKKNER
ncbi:hypothetical protein ACFVAD_17525 [Sutcliffiella sp. NPDC057660]|uniref:hypothetical protein n=1 Tax=Sutcliffiella sp. NPDC057660 TaxID=3346199 RepID=UPI0036BE1CD5